MEDSARPAGDAALPAEDAALPAQEAAAAAAGGRRRIAERALCALAVAAIVAPFVVGVVYAMSHGWTALGDEAAIAIRSFAELGRSGPLVGQFTQLSQQSSTPVYDPGPLEYWLLAVPVHLDPRYGPLWGGALWCAGASVVAVAAMRAAFGWLGAAAAAMLCAGSILSRPDMTVGALWNPYFGYFFFIASISAALAVLRRHHWWWQVVVVTGSVAAQAHLMYLVPELGICGLALARLLLRCLGGERPLPWRPLATGVGLGCGCWLGPLLQQVSGHPGNLSSIVDAGSETVPRAGWQFGLEAVAFATGPRPGWAIADPATSRSLFSSLSSSSAVEGGVVVLALVLVALTAWRTGALELATVAVVSWMLTVSLAVSFAELPVADFKSLYYLETLMLPVGCFTLVTLLVAVTVLVRALARRVFEARRRRHPAGAWSPRRAMVLGGAALGLVVSGCLIRLSTELPSVRSWSSMGEVRSAAAEIGASPHRDTIRVDVEVADGGGIANYGYTLGVAWALVAAGWDPLVGGVGAVVLGGVDAGGASAVMTALVSFGPGGSAAEVISGPLNYHELYRWRLRVQADDHAP